MTKYWFKPKRYGYGFYPISWEGWIATLGLVIIILLSGSANHFFTEFGPTNPEIIQFALDIIIFSTLATLLFERKMKEKLGWRWGRK